MAEALPHKCIAELAKVRDFAFNSFPEEKIVVSFFELFAGEFLDEFADIGFGFLQDEPQRDEIAHYQINQVII